MSQAVVNVVLDLDGTIVFPDPSGASASVDVVIPGRSRPTYLSTTVANLLEELSQTCRVYLASARNAVSVAGLVRQLPAVRFAGFVLECGLVTRASLQAGSWPASPQYLRIRQRLAGQLDTWEFVSGYEQILCCLAPGDVLDPQAIVQAALGDQGDTWRIHQERHKTFLYPSPPCKLAGLKRLGVERIAFAAGDDATYDHSILSAATFPLTTIAADQQVVSLVSSRGGYVAPQTGHAAAAQILQKLLAMTGS